MLLSSFLRTARRTGRIARTLTQLFAVSPPARKPVRRASPPKTRSGAPRATKTTTTTPAFPARPARGETFVAGTFAYRRNEHDFQIYLPPGPTPPAGLVVMLHGCKQDPRYFAAGTGMNEAARQGGLIVLYPAQSGQANAQRCWRWFEAAHQQRNAGEPGWIAALTRAVQRHYRVPARQVFIAGLSAGGAMAAVTAQQYPDMFAACGVHSGLAPGSARGVLDALSVMRGGSGPWVGVGPNVPLVRTIVFHGDHDQTVHPRHAGNVTASAMGGKPSALATESLAGSTAGGRDFTRHLYRDAAGRVVGEQWEVHGMGHAWSGGRPAGSYTDPSGPDASAAMLAFFTSPAK